MHLMGILYTFELGDKSSELGIVGVRHAPKFPVSHVVIGVAYKFRLNSLILKTLQFFSYLRIKLPIVI